MWQLQAASHAGAAMEIGEREPQERHRLAVGDAQFRIALLSGEDQ